MDSGQATKLTLLFTALDISSTSLYLIPWHQHSTHSFHLFHVQGKALLTYCTNPRTGSFPKAATLREKTEMTPGSLPVFLCSERSIRCSHHGNGLLSPAWQIYPGSLHIFSFNISLLLIFWKKTCWRVVCQGCCPFSRLLRTSMHDSYFSDVIVYHTVLVMHAFMGWLIV